MKSVSRWVASLVCLVALGAFGSANASTVTHSVPFGPISVPGGPVVVNLPSSVAALSPVLIGVELKLVANADSGSLGVENIADASGSIVDLGLGATVTAVAPAAITLIAVPTTTAFGIPLAVFDGSLDFGGTSGYTMPGSFATDSDTDTPGVFAPYDEFFSLSSTFSVSISANTFSSVVANGGTVASSPVPGITEGYVQVTYTYIPEPATAGLLGVAAVGMLRRRRAA